MQEKSNFDINTFIGFLLIGGIILYMLNTNQSSESEEDEHTEAQTERVSNKNDTPEDTSTASVATDTSQQAETDSIALAQKNEELGAFGYSAGLSSAKEETTTLENEVLKIKVNNKGGQITEAKLKGLVRHDSSQVYLIKDNNASFNVELLTTDNKTLNTEDLYFEPELTEHGDNQILSMKLKADEDKYLEYIYTLKPDDYMMDFAIKSQGLQDVLNQAQDPELNWQLKAYRDGKSISYENRYTESVWQYKGNKSSTQQPNNESEDEDEDISWVAFRQHFFTSILLNDSPFEKGTIKAENLVDDEDKDTIFTKGFAANFPLKIKGGDLNESMNMYYGPSDYKTLKKYDRNLDEIIPMGWGIFGWINHYVFIPVFSFLMNYFPAGIAIIVLTVLVKILLSPVQYKQFLSQAKQKIIRPEAEEIKNKYKDNQMKRQQETMKLNRKAGINPASGCLVGLLQIPIFIALFRLFPSIFELRHKSFLWADDLASYDVIADLPFKIPFYGSHISLFPLLASAAIFVYMTLNSNTQNMPQQPGMPNMKYIMYISPVFMLFFFNSYPSGLSVYYLTSNLISIAIVLVIKTYIIDDDKVLAKIQQNKKKPKKQNRFQRKMQEMMEEAERQKDIKK